MDIYKRTKKTYKNRSAAWEDISERTGRRVSEIRDEPHTGEHWVFELEEKDGE